MTFDRLALVGDHNTLSQLNDRLPRASTVLAPISVKLELALATSYLRLAEANPDAYLPDTAAREVML
jgi:hypothetical protein